MIVICLNSNEYVWFLYVISSYMFVILCLKLQSFITQDSGDRDTLVKNLGSLDVPVINHVGDGNREKEPFHVSEEVCFDMA